MPVSSYLDTSFVAKAYLVEYDSEAVAHFLRLKRPRPLISSLTDVEMASAFARELPSVHATASAFSLYERDKLAGVYEQVPLTGEILGLARETLLLHGGEFRLRSLNALHLATAKHHGVQAFGTYDGRLAAAAHWSGFAVVGARP